ncbi:hypothetical protein PtrSN002B_000131 [Pyrenophora tritici-repentis]|nr:hypothetical protein PtrSN002B_000131 [Pyrenophora tritici-repentis]KAI1598989.1 hypothetical protein PtrEW13061_001095 [Pyrenophora tritici-repentis]
MDTNTSVRSQWNSFRRYVLGSVAEETTPMAPPLAPPKSKTFETSIERVESWPEEARPLKKHTWLSYLYGIGDLLLVLLPVYFILLGVATASLHGKPTNGNAFGKKVESAMNLGPTIFPIVFAAICGRSMKIIARYLVERGTKISTLELLMASQSVWGTFESQLLMQRLTVVGVNLLFLWALSPLGGQASLRLMSREHEASYSSIKLRYLTTGPAGAIFPIATGNLAGGKYAQAGALYNAALLAPQSVKLGPQDSWGNVKIPSLDAPNQSVPDTDGWIEVSRQVSVPETYTSLVGVPVAGLPSNASSNFTLEYNYMAVSCGPFKQELYPGTHGTNEPTSTNYTKLDEMIPGQIWSNKSDWELHPFDTLDGPASFLIDTTRDLARSPPTNQLDRDLYLGRLDGFAGHYNQSRLSESEKNTPRDLTFASVYGITKDGMTQGLNIATCTLLQHHVEAYVKCAGTQCAASKTRKSITDTRPNALTAFESFEILKNVAHKFPTAIKFTEGSSPTELFLANTSSFPFIQKAGRLYADVAYANLFGLQPDVFSRRLSLVLNTYYQLSSQSSGYFGSLSNNLSAYGPDTLPVTDANVYLPANLSITEHSVFSWFTKFSQTIDQTNSAFLGATTTGNTTSTEEIFVCNVAWLALLLAASTVILITGSVGLILKRKTLGPEMFGFVTSMTYENPWLKIPQGGTMLDAMERARLLKDVEVHIADVRGDDDIGHIALASGIPLRKLERGRLYR